MDIATVIGIALAMGLILASIIMGVGLGPFIDVPSILIVIGGTIASLLICFPMGSVIGAIKVFLKTMLGKTPAPTEIIDEIVELAVTARKDSILALEKVEIADPFLAKGIKLVVDGTAPDLVTSILNTEIKFMKQRHLEGAKIFGTVSAMAPAFGMIGTLIGLVQMLQNLSDPSAIGPSMAVALLTTFYGAVIANIFGAPIKTKLEGKSVEEALLKEVVMQGVLSIMEGDNPMIVRSKLEAFLSPKMRKPEEE
jgi:chemotaxis protein MotA